MGIAQAVKVFEADGGRPATKLTLLYLAFLADRKGRIRDSGNQIGIRTGLARTTIRRELDFLVATDLIEKTAHGRYQLLNTLNDPDFLEGALAVPTKWPAH